MKPNNAEMSALAAASIRAIESYRPEGERLFEDHFTRSLMPPFWHAVVKLLSLPGLGDAVLAIRERQFPGAIGNLLCRTRFIDERVVLAQVTGDMI